MAVIRYRWCGTCGAEQLFTQDLLVRMVLVPRCPRCGSPLDCDEWDALIDSAPRELD